jgi:hypothetical protein
LGSPSNSTNPYTDPAAQEAWQQGYAAGQAVPTGPLQMPDGYTQDQERAFQDGVAAGRQAPADSRPPMDLNNPPIDPSRKMEGSGQGTGLLLEGGSVAIPLGRDLAAPGEGIEPMPPLPIPLAVALVFFAILLYPNESIVTDEDEQRMIEESKRQWAASHPDAPPSPQLVPLNASPSLPDELYNYLVRQGVLVVDAIGQVSLAVSYEEGVERPFDDLIENAKTAADVRPGGRCSDVWNQFRQARNALRVARGTDGWLDALCACYDAAETFIQCMNTLPPDGGGGGGQSISDPFAAAA